MIEITKTFLESIDMIANIYFALWLISEFYIRSKMLIVELPCMPKGIRYRPINIIAYVALFIILFLPKALYQ